MRTMKNRRKSALILSMCLAMNISIAGSALAQTPTAIQQTKATLTEAEVEAKLAHLEALCQKNLRAEVVNEFKHEDMAAWLAAFKDKGVGIGKVMKALNLRGTSLAQQKEYELAKKDYTYALELSPSHGYTWGSLGSIYRRLGDDDKALEAYNKAYEYDSASHTGKSFGWMPIDATLEAVSILIHRADYAAALKTLERYTHEDIAQMAKSWGCRIYRAYGQVYAVMGREEEALANYKAALELENKQD